MGYYTQYEITVPDALMELFEKDPEVDAHIKALQEKGLKVELNYEDFQRDVTADVQLTFGRDGSPYFIADGYGFYHLGGNEFSNEESAKFYDWKAVFTKLSAEVPGLFVVEGDGEEQGDHWRAYFRDGKTYTQKPIFPDFDPDRLE